MEIRGLAFLPILWVTWALLGVSALFALTVISGHETKPYISDTGNEFPESVLYKVVFMVSAIIGVVVACIQYKFMILQSEPSEKRHIIGQRILLALGWIMCIGTVMNAVYSVKANATVHRIAAGMAFIPAGIYNLCQAACLYKRSFSSRQMCHIRLAATLATTLVLMILGVSRVSFYFQLCNGMELFYVGLVTEWTGFFGLAIYQLFNITDFQHLSLTLSRKGVSICLREKTQDPENPSKIKGMDLGTGAP